MTTRRYRYTYQHLYEMRETLNEPWPDSHDLRRNQSKHKPKSPLVYDK